MIFCAGPERTVQKAGELGWIFWKNPMPVVQYQRQQRKTVAAACGISQRAKHQHTAVK